MGIFVIFNPIASRSAGVSSLLNRHSMRHELQWCPTSEDLSAAKLARQAMRNGFPRIIVIGGDGTMSEVLNGIAPDFSAELALVPTGTGNDFARSIGIPLDSIEAALDLAVQNQSRSIDVIQAEANGSKMFCLNAVNGGLGGYVAADVESEVKKQWGVLAYWFTTISKCLQLPAFELTIKLDGKTSNLTSPGLAIANGRYVGGGFPIAPHAKLDDGLLDITVVPMLPFVELMASGLNFVLGNHELEERVQMFQAHSVHISSKPTMPYSIDGEPVRSLDAEFSIIPGAVKIVTGDSPLTLNSAS